MSLFALVHNNATAIAWGTTVTLVGIVLEALGVAYLTNYRGIAHRAHERNISNWESAPILGKYIAPRVAQTPERRTKVAMGLIFLIFGTVALTLGVFSLAPPLFGG